MWSEKCMYFCRQTSAYPAFMRHRKSHILQLTNYVLLQMIKFTRLFLTILCTGLLMSCLGTNDETTTEYDSPIISNMVLGNLKATVTVKTSAGKDSSYIGTLAGIAYPIYIDQINNRIYTADSLPYGTNLTKVVFSNATATGTIAIKKLNEDVDTVFSATDSTDFSVPRTLTVYGYDGSSKRSYTVSILMHKEIADSTSWNSFATTAFASTTVKRVFANDDNLTVFALDGATPVVLTASKSAPAVWTSTIIAQSSIDLSSVQQMQGVFYALVGGQLMSSTDAVNWTALSPNVVPTALAMAGNERLIGVVGGQFYGTTDGTTWEADSIIMSDEALPSSNFAGSTLPLSTDNTLVDYLLIGEDNGAMVTWKRTIDTTGGETYPWVSYPAPTAYALPNLDNVSLTAYGTGSLLLGMNNGAPSSLYWSRDNGRTWRPNIITAPATLSGTSVVLATDDDNFIWVIAGGSSQVWRGRYHRVSWGTSQKTWTKAPQMMQ